MSFRRWRQFRWIYVVLLVVTGTGLAVFQNCSGSSGSLSFGGTVNLLLATQPIPISYNLNEISYMSCPMSGAATSTSGLLPTPFYRIRVGSFDNSSANGFFNPVVGGTAPADQVGGIGFSTAALNYIRKGSSGTVAWGNLQKYLQSSPYTTSSQPVVVMLNQQRDTNPNDLTGLAQTALGQQLLMPFSDPTFSAALSQATQIPNAGTTPSGYFPTLTNGQNNLMATLNWGSSVADENTFRANWLASSEYIVAGFAPASDSSPTSMIQNLENPQTAAALNGQTGTSIGTSAGNLFGYGYKFLFNASTNVQNHPLLDPTMMTAPEEFDLNPNSSTVNPIPGEAWDCFSLTIVRDIDRKYWTAASQITSQPSPYLSKLFSGTSVLMTFYPGNVIHPYDVANGIGSSNPSLNVNYINDGPTSIVPTTNDIPYLMFNLEAGYTNAALTQNAAAGTIVGPSFPGLNSSNAAANNINPLYTIPLGMGANDGGTYYACPPEDPSGQTGAVSTLSASAKAINKERLRIVRRFLPAAYWEVNMADMCAVATPAAESMGSCYASGDSNQSLFIQYNAVPENSGSVPGCGTSTSPASATPECPAKVSFCWRYH